MTRVPVEDVAGWMDHAQSAGAIGPDTRSVLLHDLPRMRAHVRALVEAFPTGTLHATAIKANPVVGVLRELVQAGAGLEAASWEEVCLARAAECPAERIVYDSPAKTEAELTEAIALGCWINADHPEELARIEQLGPPAGGVGLRVNPQVGEGRIAATSTAGRGSRFGVPLHEAAHWVSRYPFVRGLHVHTGSQGIGLPLLREAARATADAVEALDLDVLDVGGGLPVRYTERDPEPATAADWAASLRDLPSWSRRRWITECGRSVQAGCGVALTRIEATKEVDGAPMVIAHLGADFALRRIYRPDQWDHEILLLDASGVPRTGALRPTIVGGPLCFSGDLWDRARLLPEARAGDWLLIRDVGAYTLSMWSRHCSRGLPPTWGVDGDRLARLHPGETPADVVRFWGG